MASSITLQSLFLVLLILKLCGLIHFSIKDTRLNTFLNHLYVIFPVLTLTLLTSLYFYLLDSDIDQSSLNAISLEVYSFIVQSQLTMNFLSAFVSVLQAILNSKEQRKFFLQIDRIDKLLSRQFSTYRIKNWPTVLISIWPVAMSFVIYTLRIFYAVKDLDIILYTLYSTLIVLVKGNLVKYFLFVNLMSSRLQISLNIIEKVQRSERNVILKEIQTIRKIYNIIWENVVIINKSLGLSLIFIFIALFLSMAHKAYLMFLAAKSSTVQMDFLFGNNSIFVN